MSARFARGLQRLHHSFGSLFALLLALWFSSGAIMTFADFPSYSEAERLASAPRLMHDARLELAPALKQWLQRGALSRGARPRMAMLEGLPTWVLSDENGVRRAWRSVPPFDVLELDEARARAELARRSRKRIAAVERVEQPDQWSVGLAQPGALPFYRAWLADDGSEASRGEQLYLSARTGEIVQDTVQSERALAWLGAIPHWIYPTLLRRERALWRTAVLTLSALGLVVSLSGTCAGLVLWQRRRKKHIRRQVHDPILRWHHRLGLGFGLLASSWLFSGALSLEPFHWTGDEGPSVQEQAAVHGGAFEPGSWELSRALASCERELEVRELELASLRGRAYAVCYDQTGDTRLIDLSDPSLTPRRALSRAVFAELARELTQRGLSASVSEQHRYDSYYYPTHRNPRATLPYLRVDLRDADETSLYLDPSRARVLLRTTRRGRIERWLYHGLHSFDLPWLYRHTALWRTLIIASMIVGATLSLLGLAMSVRKMRRRQQRGARAERAR
ncbi:MAG: PepSY-associated helix domain protein [Myxococcaceae bacterium]|nr:PepSY-associated helix domain protein [Myxococcaceae bacterium]